MAITKRVEETKIEVVKPFNHINVRTDTIAEEDGVEIGRSSHRHNICLLYTSPSPRDKRQSRMPSSA